MHPTRVIPPRGRSRLPGTGFLFASEKGSGISHTVQPPPPGTEAHLPRSVIRAPVPYFSTLGVENTIAFTAKGQRQPGKISYFMRNMYHKASPIRLTDQRSLQIPSHPPLRSGQLRDCKSTLPRWTRCYKRILRFSCVCLTRADHGRRVFIFRFSLYSALVTITLTPVPAAFSSAT